MEGATLYCEWCDQIVLVEHNPEWVADGRPFRFEKDYEWFTRCPECKSSFYQGSPYECPECGCSPPDDDENTIYGERHYNYAQSMEFGECYDWEETHTCHICGTVYTFVNGNC